MHPVFFFTTSFWQETPLVLSYYLDYLKCIDKKLPAFQCMFASAYTPLDGRFLCVHLCLALSGVHSALWWVGKCRFFSHKAGEMFLHPCYKVSRSRLSVCPSCMARLTMDERWYLCSTPHPQAAHFTLWKCTGFLNNFFLHCFSTIKRNIFQSCPKKHTSGNAVVCSISGISNSVLCVG